MIYNNVTLDTFESESDFNEIKKRFQDDLDSKYGKVFLKLDVIDFRYKRISFRFELDSDFLFEKIYEKLKNVLGESYISLTECGAYIKTLLDSDSIDSAISQINDIFEYENNRISDSGFSISYDLNTTSYESGIKLEIDATLIEPKSRAFAYESLIKG